MWPHPPGRPLHSLRASFALAHPQPRLPRIFHIPEPLWGSEVGKFHALPCTKVTLLSPTPCNPPKQARALGEAQVQTLAPHIQDILLHLNNFGHFDIFNFLL